MGVSSSHQFHRAKVRMHMDKRQFPLKTSNNNTRKELDRQNSKHVNMIYSAIYFHGKCNLSNVEKPKDAGSIELCRFWWKFERF